MFTLAAPSPIYAQVTSSDDPVEALRQLRSRGKPHRDTRLKRKKEIEKKKAVRSQRVNRLNGTSTAKVYYSDSNSSDPATPFYEYDVATNSWTQKAPLPGTNTTQITSDELGNVYALPEDGKIYRYVPTTDVWEFVMNGPTASVGQNNISMSEAHGGEFYWGDDGTATLHYTVGGAWNSIATPRNVSSGSAVDRGTGVIYIRTFSQLGFFAFDPATQTFPKVCDVSSSILENSRVGAFFNGEFFTRTADGPYQAINVSTCTVRDTGQAPLSFHSATAEDQNGNIYSNGYTNANVFEVFNVPTNTITPLGNAPIIPGNAHSTLVAVSGAASQVVQLGTPPGDGGVTVSIDAYGSFGSDVGGAASDAIYDPVGDIEEAGMVFQSGAAIRIGESGTRTFLTTGDIAGTGGLRDPAFEEILPEGCEQNPPCTSAMSTFTFGDLDFTLAQEASELLEEGVRTGSLLIQTYTITNPGPDPVTFEIVRYLDGDIQFDGSIEEGGGRRVGRDVEILFEMDSGENPNTPTSYVGVTAEGGSADLPGRYEIDQFDLLVTKIVSGEALNDTIVGDGPDRDQFIEAGSEYDVTLALRNSFTLEPGGSTIYTTRTFFASGPPGGINLPPVADPQEIRTREDEPVTITLRGDDPEGASLSFEIVDPPTNGTLTLSALKFRRRSWVQRALAVGEAAYTYTPDPGFNGTDSFTFKVNDGKLDSAIVTIPINVIPVIDLSNLAFEQREAGDEEGGIAFSTPGIAALVDYDHTNDSGVSAQQLEVVTKAQNVPNECKEKLDPSDIATEKFSVEELPDPVLGSVSFKVWEVGPQAMETAAQHGCTSVTLQMADFKVTGVDDAEVKSQPLLGEEFSITATVEQTGGQSKKGSLRAKGKSRARLTPPTSSRSKKSR